MRWLSGISRKSQRLFLYAAFLFALPMLLSGVFFEVLQDLTGQVLIATEKAGPPFDKSLILLDNRGPLGAVGVILNKPLSDEQRSKINPFLQKASFPVYYGGPVNFPETLYVMEKMDRKNPGDKLRFDVTEWKEKEKKVPDLLNRIANSYEKGEQRYLVFAGCASWAPAQLDAEINKEKTWYEIPVNHDVIFQNGEDVRWEALLRMAKKNDDLRRFRGV